MPFHPAPVDTEKDAIAGFLGQQQDAFRALAHGLSATQATDAPSASALSIHGLVHHVTLVQENWLDGALHAPDRVPTELVEERMATSGDGFTTSSGLVEVLAAFDETCARVLSAVHELDLDAPVPVPDLPWFPKDVTAWSVRWVWFHLLEELARHAGHGDIVRETIDGATMYELVAAQQDLPEIPPYVRQWRPRQPAGRA